MTPEERRQEVARRLAADPTLSQRTIAKALGVSQASVARDIAVLRESSGESRVNQHARGASAQVNRGMTRGDSPVVTPISPEGISALMNYYASSGDKLVAAIRADLDSRGLEPDAREEGLLAEVHATADIIAAAQRRLDADGLVFSPATKGGPPRPHPLLAELRGQRVVLARLLSQISMEEGSKNPVKVKAANTRWRARQMPREAGIG